MKSLKDTTVRVAFYIRVSTDEQTEKYGIPMQKDALMGILKSRGKLANGDDCMTLAGEQFIYVDEGVSGTTQLDERPAFLKLKQDILMAGDTKPFDLVAVYKIDRFARKLKILLEVVDFFEEHKIDFVSANEMIDTSTPFGKAMLNIIGVIAELERETIRQRTKDGREQALKSGKVMGASAKFGYKKSISGGLELFEDEAKIVRDIFNMFVSDKMTAYQIALKLGELGIPSPSASAIINKKRKGEILKKNSIVHWKPEKVRDILGDEIYLGKYYYDKVVNRKLQPKANWKLSKVSHQPIIDDTTFEIAQKYLENSKHERISEDGHTYLLSGLLRCSHCFDADNDKSMVHWNGGKKEIGKGTGKFTYFYQCSRKNKSKSYKPCEVIPLPADGIEEYIKNYLFKLLENPRSVYEHNLKLTSTKQEIKLLQKKFTDLKSLNNSILLQRDKLREQHKLGYLDTSKLQEEYKVLDEREIKIQQTLAELGKQIQTDTNTNNSLLSLELFSEKYKVTLEKAKTDRNLQYEIIHKLCEEIVVYSAGIGKSTKIAGKRKENQQMPHKLHIKLKLPKEILMEIENQKLMKIYYSPNGVLGENPLLVRNKFSHGNIHNGREDNIILYCYNLDKVIKRIGQNRYQKAYAKQGK